MIGIRAAFMCAVIVGAVFAGPSRVTEFGEPMFAERIVRVGWARGLEQLTLRHRLVLAGDKFRSSVEIAEFASAIEDVGGGRLLWWGLDGRMRVGIIHEGAVEFGPRWSASVSGNVVTIDDRQNGERLVYRSGEFVKLIAEDGVVGVERTVNGVVYRYERCGVGEVITIRKSRLKDEIEGKDFRVKMHLNEIGQVVACESTIKGKITVWEMEYENGLVANFNGIEYQWGEVENMEYFVYPGVLPPVVVNDGEFSYRHMQWSKRREVEYKSIVGGPIGRWVVRAGRGAH